MIAAILRVFWPYALAATGGLASERSGVTNLALEGFLLAGAFLCAAGTLLSGSPLVGLLLAVAGDVALALVYLWACERRRDQQVLIGIAFNLLALGGSKLLLKLVFGSAANSPRLPHTLPMGVVAAMALTGAFVFLEKSVPGLRIRAAGDGPSALRALHLSVQRPRRMALALTGALCALGGATLCFGQAEFTDGMTAGRGYIAVAAVVFGGWRLVPTLLSCLLFAAAETSQLWLQDRLPLPPQLSQALPYLLCLLALTLRRGRARPPAALAG